MIKRVKVVITFPLGARFASNLNIDVYRSLISFIKDLMCFNSASKCKDCIKKNQCKYYQLTGENFTNYPGVLIHNNIFEKRYYKNGQQKEFTFYFIGNNDIYVDYIEIYFNQYLKQNLFHNAFYLNSIQTKKVTEEEIENVRCTCLTPIEVIDFNNSYNEMISYYNQTYNTGFTLLEGSNPLTNIREVSWDVIRLKSRNIFVKGYIGHVNIDKMNNQFLQIGVGKYNYIGGGQIEIKDRDEK